MGLSLERGSLCCISVLLFIGVLLTLILVPLSYSYIPRNEMGFKKTQATNEIDQTVVYRNGRYFWGVGKTAVTFPSNFQKVSLTGSQKLSVFTDSGQVLYFGCVFFYRLLPSRLKDLYGNFSTNYEQRVIAVARSSLRNAAANLTMAAYIEGRASTINFLYNAMSQALLTTAFVQVPSSHFAMLFVEFPSIVVTQRTNLFINNQQQITNNYSYTASQIRLATTTTVTQLNNNAALVKQQAQANASRLVTEATSRAFQRAQVQTGASLKLMIDSLNLTSNRTAATELIKLNTLLDSSSSLTLLNNLGGSVLINP